MIEIVSFKNVKDNEEFVYLDHAYRKVITSTGRVGALNLISQQIYPDCEYWTNCFVFRSDTNSEITKTNPNRTNFSIISNDGELYNIISLTPSQTRLLDWLDDNGYFSDDINIEKAPSIKVIEV